MADSLEGSKQKIERARDHILEVRNEIVAFLQTEPYPWVFYEDRESVKGRALIKAKFIGNIPAKISVVIGDTVQNLRASLDYLACALAKQNGHINIADVYFPFAGSKEDFESKDTQKKIGKLSHDAVAMISNLQPYRGGNDFLWALNKSSVLDKHQNLIPVGAAAQGASLKFLMSPGTTETLTFSAPSHFQPLVNEVILLDYPALIPSGDGEIDFTVDIAFSGIAVFEGISVVMVLNILFNLTQNIILTFEEKFFKI